MALTSVFFGINLVLTLTAVVSGQATFNQPPNSFAYSSSSANAQTTYPHMSNTGTNAYNSPTDGSGLYRSNPGFNSPGPSNYGSPAGPSSFGPSRDTNAHASAGSYTTSGSSGMTHSTAGAPPPNADSSRGSSPHSPARPHLTTVPPQSASLPSDPLGGCKIVCLFNTKNFLKVGLSPAMIDPSLCTHLNYEFAILDPMTYEMITSEPDLDIQKNFYQEATGLRKWNPKLKVLISLGGWEDSTKKYSEMAADSSKRKNFVEKAVTFLKAHSFDGMDLAWEYPNCWQGAIGVNPKDKDNFSLLLKELRTAFDEADLELSASVGAIKREIDAAYNVPEVSEAVDHLNVMTYDMHGPWESVTGHHTQFEKREEDSDPYCNVKEAIQIWIDKGADKKKLNVGIALYGKTFTLVDPDNCGVGAPARGIGDAGPKSNNGGFMYYNEICVNLNAGNWTEKDEKYVGFYAYSGDQWVCYDPPMMVVRKTKYVVETGLGGVLLKDLSGDDFEGTCFSMPFPLTKMARLEMIQKVKRMNRHHG